MSQWRIRHSHELQTLYEGVDIVSHIRVRRSNWICQVNWMDDTRIPEKSSKFSTVSLRT